MSPLSPSDYLDAIRANGATLVDAADAAGLDTPVPACPGWTVADLLKHMGRVHRWVAANARGAPADGPVDFRALEIPEAEDRAEWVRVGVDELVDALDRPPNTPAWTFLPPSTVAFWQRRQAHETAMHRVDAEQAAGKVTPIDVALAADGIDEYLAMVGRAPGRPVPTGQGESLHFHCTDTEGEWVARLGADGVEIERVHEKGDVAARGTAFDLLCWLEGRAPVERLEVFGDASLLDRWRDAATF